MDRRAIAKELGRKGGQVRAARLTAAQRSRIAALGAAARRHSLEAARRIADNFAYATAAAVLRRETSRVTQMPDAVDHLDEVASVVDSLTGLGLEPILVGGMAMVIIGSRRVTRDFDFVIPQPGERLPQLVEIFYDRGLELASRVNRAGDIAATIDNPRVAVARIRHDAPASAYFLNPETGLRIDLLFDFPVPAAELARGARRTKIRSRALRVASEADLLRLKKIARGKRSAPGDAEDVAFLEARSRRRKPR